MREAAVDYQIWFKTYFIPYLNCTGTPRPAIVIFDGHNPHMTYSLLSSFLIVYQPILLASFNGCYFEFRNDPAAGYYGQSPEIEFLKKNY